MFTVVPASETSETLDYVNWILKEKRNIEFAAKEFRNGINTFLINVLKYTLRKV